MCENRERTLELLNSIIQGCMENISRVEKARAILEDRSCTMAPSELHDAAHFLGQDAGLTKDVIDCIDNNKRIP